MIIFYKKLFILKDYYFKRYFNFIKFENIIHVYERQGSFNLYFLCILSEKFCIKFYEI